jgi:hypothetical protein
MGAVIPSLSAVAVSAIFCLWRAYARRENLHRRELLRERVTYMLWVIAHQID